VTATGMGWAFQAPWLRNLPPTWEVRRFAHVTRLVEDRNDDGSDARLLSLSTTKGIVPKAWEHDSQVRSGEDLRKYWRVTPGHIVVNPMWVMNGAVAESQISGVISPDYRVYAPQPDVWPRYLHHLLHSREYLSLYALLTRGSTTFDRRISKEDFHGLPIIVPPFAAQREITDFLDKKTATINALIAKKERLIELLQERRQALITQAVTKGLDPHVPMKDSGIEWIGETPAHWRTQKTRFLCRLTTGERDTQDAVEGGRYPFFVRSQTVHQIDTYSFDGEAVLTSGDGAGVGKIFHHHVGKMEVHQRVYRYFDFRNVTGRFFFYFLREHLQRVVLAGNAKSTVDSLRRPQLVDFPVTLPSLHEQELIVEFLDRTVARHEAAMDVCEQQVKRLGEYRQALITAAVTGKLDVLTGRGA
jgi:type I restriction enzyme, S subunit